MGVTTATRREALEAAGLIHPNPEAVTATLFQEGGPFFLVDDKVQVKYEMLRAHVVDGVADFGGSRPRYSRPAFYLVAAAFDERGMAGLLDERRGRRGPLKISPEIEVFIAEAETVAVWCATGGSGLRAVRRVTAPPDDRAGPGPVRRFWPAAEAAQAAIRCFARWS